MFADAGPRSPRAGNRRRRAGASCPAHPLHCPVHDGSTTDILARILAEHAQAEFGQPLIIESRPGAGLLSGVSAYKTKLAI